MLADVRKQFVFEFGTFCAKFFKLGREEITRVFGHVQRVIVKFAHF